MHALIIEDEALIALAIEDALRECGYISFDFASSAATAIVAGRERCPDLITADVRLSPGCGIETVKAICSDRDIPVIFITGSAAELIERRPGSMIVHKPFGTSDVAEAVRHVTA